MLCVCIIVRDTNSVGFVDTRDERLYIEPPTVCNTFWDACEPPRLQIAWRRRRELNR